MPRKGSSEKQQTNRIDHSRHRFVQGMAAAGAVALFARPTFGENVSTEPSVLRGDRFDLTIDALRVNITGRVMATAAKLLRPNRSLCASGRRACSRLRPCRWNLRLEVRSDDRN